MSGGGFLDKVALDLAVMSEGHSSRQAKSRSPVGRGSVPRRISAEEPFPACLFPSSFPEVAPTRPIAYNRGSLGNREPVGPTIPS